MTVIQIHDSVEKDANREAQEDPLCTAYSHNLGNVLHKGELNTEL